MYFRQASLALAALSLSCIMLLASSPLRQENSNLFHALTGVFLGILTLSAVIYSFALSRLLRDRRISRTKHGVDTLAELELGLREVYWFTLGGTVANGAATLLSLFDTTYSPNGQTAGGLFAFFGVVTVMTRGMTRLGEAARVAHEMVASSAKLVDIRVSARLLQAMDTRSLLIEEIKAQLSVLQEHADRAMEEPPIVIRDRALCQTVFGRLLSVTQMETIVAVLSPGPSGGNSELGKILQGEEIRLLERDVQIEKFYLFFTEAYYSPGALKTVSLANLGPLIENSGALMSDEPVARNADAGCAVNLVYRSHLADLSPQSERPILNIVFRDSPSSASSHSVNADLVVDPGAQESPLWEVFALGQRTGAAHALFIEERNSAGDFQQAWFWPKVSDSLSAGVKRFFSALRESSRRWKPGADMIEYAIRNAIAIRDSSPEEHIWITDDIQADEVPKIDSWYHEWFPGGPGDLDRLIGRRLVWQVTMQNNDFKRLDLRRTFLLPDLGAQEFGEPLAVSVVAAMTLNILYNVHCRCAYKSSLELGGEKAKILDCMIKWQSFRPTAEPAPGSQIYWCGVPEKGSPFYSLTEDPLPIKLYDSLWQDTEKCFALVRFIAKVKGTIGGSLDEFLGRASSLIEESLVKLDAASRWNNPDKLRWVQVREKRRYSLASMIGAQPSETNPPDEQKPTREFWRELIITSLGAGES